MAEALTIDMNYLMDFLAGLLNIPSPTGYSEEAVAYTEKALAELLPDAPRNVTRKGGLAVTWPGLAADRPRALTAHVDTLGAMVKEIKSTGRLRLTKIGGFAWQTVEGEGLTVLTAAGRKVRGALLPVKASTHIHSGEVNSMERKDENMEVRLDARVSTADETRAAGVEVGDFVAFDPRVEMGEAGFVRSRHLDDKACVAILLAAVKAVRDAGRQPAQRTTLHISNYEEVGHGAAAGFPPDLAELLTLDMAAVGEGQNSDEFSVGICVKDSGGPYHLAMRRKLVKIAQEAGIPYKLDIYMYYGSDGEALWRAGGDVQVGLVGPGVDASHSYERTHRDSLESTARLVAEYLVRP
jgi:putative aminopeptidase FrvX